MLDGRTAVITGTASGIGRGTALRFAELGASKIACLDLHTKNNEGTAHELCAMGVDAIAVTVDLGDVDQIVAAYEMSAERLGRIDAACHIGGFSWRGETLDVTTALWDSVINANLRGAFFCCQQALRIMYPQASGAIVNMSADAAFHPMQGFAVQAAGKGGLALMTQTLALEAARRGVRLNVVSPGIVKTERGGVDKPAEPPLRRDPQPAVQSIEALLAEQTAPGRWLTIEEIANSFAYLCSDLASGINGQIIAVNGGGYFSLQY